MRIFSKNFNLRQLSRLLKDSWKGSILNLWKKDLEASNKDKQNSAIKSARVTTETQDKIFSFYANLLKTDSKSIENVFIAQNGISIFFHSFEKNNQIKICLQLFELSQQDHALFLEPKVIYEMETGDEQWEFIELIKVNSDFRALWRGSKSGFKEITYPNYLISNEIELKNPLPKLARPISNPMLVPNKRNSWEAFCTFNPAAVFAADKVHLLYRAQGHDYISKIGYASSEDGMQIDYRHQKPVYVPTQTFEGATLPPGDPDNPFVSGGGCGGCEDPRATIIDDRIYMTYVAYNGWDHPRIAITSIALSDFLNDKFFWEKPVLISRPGIVDKSACLFPEKINGKYVIMHRVFPNIYIDYVDSLDFDGQIFLTETHKIRPRSREWWDSRKIGAGAPPLKTKEGWLLIYQAVDDKDASEYKVGAMLLDLEDPSKVLYRSSSPILEPRESYENNGFKSGVVYPCGAVIKDETLFVYYGAADSYVCVATANLDQFLSDLKKTSKTTLDSGLFLLSS